MSNGPIRGETPQDKTASQHMLGGWQHLQRALGRDLHQAIKRSRALADSALRGKSR